MNVSIVGSGFLDQEWQTIGKSGKPTQPKLIGIKDGISRSLKGRVSSGSEYKVLSKEVKSITKEDFQNNTSITSIVKTVIQVPKGYVDEKMERDEFRKKVYFSQKSVGCCIRDLSKKGDPDFLPLVDLVKIFESNGFDPLKPPIELVSYVNEVNEEVLVALDNRRSIAVYFTEKMPGNIPVRIYREQEELPSAAVKRFSGKSTVEEGVEFLAKFENNKLGERVNVTYRHAVIARINNLIFSDKINKEPFFYFPSCNAIGSDYGVTKDHLEHVKAYNKIKKIINL